MRSGAGAQRSSEQAERRSASARPVGRPSATEGGRDTRADILDAARTLFAEFGFDSTSMRAVAARAGVDVALIYHHFGSKDALLRLAIAVPKSAERHRRPIPADTPEPGKAVVRAVLQMWEQDPDLRRQALAIFRTAVSHDLAAQQLQAQHTAYVLDLVNNIVAPDGKQLRAGLIGSQLHGLLVNRYLFGVPSLTAPDIETLIEAVAPTIDHYLTGTLSRDPGRRASGQRASGRPRKTPPTPNAHSGRGADVDRRDEERR